MKTIYPFMGLALCGAAAQAQEKPNFLIIQCDHLTQRVVGAYGHTQGCTLPIDEVASRGVIFSNAYVGCPLSQPSRAALWSGMMPHQTNVRSNSSEPVNTRLPENVPTLGSLFSENGYEAVHFGKTHDMGSLRGFKHKEPVAKPFTDPEFPVNNDSFLDVGTCEDAVAYLSNPPKEPLSALQIFRTRIISADSSAKTQEYTPTGRSADRCPNCRTTLMWKTGAIFRLPYNISVAVTAA